MMASSDPQYSFIATRLAAAVIYSNPAHMVPGFFDVLLRLLDHVPSLHDSQGMDDLYAWALKNHDRLVDASLGTPCSTESLESADLDPIKGLVLAIIGCVLQDFIRIT